MGDTRTSTLAGQFLARARSLFGGRLFERVRHIFWAGLVSIGMYAVLLLQPVDQFFWLIQSRLAEGSPSGEVVFVTSDDPLNSVDKPETRYDVARALDELDRRGVGKVFLDIPFAPSDDSAADQRLAKAIADLGPRITLVDRVVPTSTKGSAVRSTAPWIGGDTPRVLADETDRNVFGFAWQMRYSYVVEGRAYRSLGAAIGGVSDIRPGSFAIDYGFESFGLPVMLVEELNARASLNSDADVDVTGKTVVIGHSNFVGGQSRPIPGSIDAPPSLIDIYAGESLRSGKIGYIRGSTVLAVFATLLLIAIALGSSRKRRWIAYTGVVGLLPAIFFASAKLGIRLDLAYVLSFFLIFGALRSRMRWKRRVEMVNLETGLPKLRALEGRLLRDNIRSGHVVIAKIQNYERVLKTLRSDEKGSYVLKLVDRLRAADPNLAIYSDGHHLGWHVASDETDSVTDHLEGLRAIFAAPVRVGGYSVDVGITFGVAAIEGDPAARLAAAVAAAEETSEAHNPIAIADTGSQTDLLWDISLRARIDDAMEAGEIYCVYQPKYDLATNTIAGVEALVRWHDPARGFISPMHFIQQCEKAGRMEHLTRYVLQSACSAGQLLHFRGRMITMSVNISATLLGDMRIAGIVRNVLQATRFDPEYLTLEITETARISDHTVAASILEELKTLGVKISMDDFGVGSASFEAFYELPFDELKIDRLFVSNMAKDPKAKAIVASLAAMGREARITVVAEGLENPQDIGLLKKIGCQQVQGFAFSRPVSLSNLMEFKDFAETQNAANMV